MTIQTTVHSDPITECVVAKGATASAHTTKRDDGLRASKIVIVDDEITNIKVVQAYLAMNGYTNVASTTDAREAIALVEANEPDALLLDVMMPHVDGLSILSSLRSHDRWTPMPIVILTAASDGVTKQRALELGATDFLQKPIDPHDLLPRIRTVLTVKKHFDHLQHYSEELELEVQRRTADLAWSRWETMQCLSRLADIRDDDTGRHVHRVARYSAIIAEELGWERNRFEILEQGAKLHDVGKIAISEAILLKPYKLTRDDFEIAAQYAPEFVSVGHPLSEVEQQLLDQHTKLGARLLAAMRSPILKLAANISLTHHERWDGLGYPCGLRGEAIPIEGRIVAVADYYETLTAGQQPRPSFTPERCLEIVAEESATRFDPDVVQALIRCHPRIEQTRHDMIDAK